MVGLLKPWLLNRNCGICIIIWSPFNLSGDSFRWAITPHSTIGQPIALAVPAPCEGTEGSHRVNSDTAPIFTHSMCNISIVYITGLYLNSFLHLSFLLVSLSELLCLIRKPAAASNSSS